MFNNGVGRPGTDYTTVFEITPPLLPDHTYALTPGQAYGPVSTTWTYEAPPANFSAIIGGTQRLPNGNTLITYGIKGHLSEVTPAGVEVWKYVNPYAADQMLGPMDMIPPVGINDPLLGTLLVNFTFRAIYYPTSYLESVLPTAPLGRFLFYNQSAFDGNTPGVSPQDDAAIATDKTPYFPGGGVAPPAAPPAIKKASTA